MARDYNKESEWQKATYQTFRFQARKDNGEAERLKEVLGNLSFTEWVRKNMKINENNSK